MDTPSEIDLPGELLSRDAVIAEQAKMIVALTTKLGALTTKVETLEGLVLKQAELLRRNSKNSNLPPSSDGPGVSAPKAGGKGQGRKRGGQKTAPSTPGVNSYL